MQEINSSSAQKSDSGSSKRLYLQIADRLAARISDGEITEGQRLPAERELATEYDVSRQTVREALIALEVSGLVEIRPGSGVYVLRSSNGGSAVVSDDAPGPLEIMDARVLVEARAAELAAGQISNEDLLRLKAYLKQMELLIGNKDVLKAEEFDRKFHLTIAEAARNGALYSIIEWLWAMRNSSEISRVFSEKVRAHGMKPNIKDHTQIYEAIARRDAEGARQAMETHITQVTEAYLSFITE